MRILHIINGLPAGGAEALLYRLATRSSDLEHEVVSLVAPNWYSPELAAKGVTVHYLNIKSAVEAVAALPRLYKIIRASGADVVQTWLYRANVYGGLAALVARVPVVWGIHTGSLEPLRLVARLWVYLGGLIARWVPSFVINCSTGSAEVHSRIGYAAAPGAVIPNGYDPDVFVPDEQARDTTRQALGIAAGTFAVGFIRRWAPVKDVPTLVRALGLVRKRGIPFRAVFAGIDLDPGNAELAKLIADSGCEDVVSLLGRRSDVADIARAVDLHLLSSLVEAFPNIVAETMLSGTPNIVTDVGDCALMVGDTGWVVPPGDADKIASAIEQAHAEWKDRPAQWQQRRTEARRLIAERFTFEQMAQDYENVWRKVARKTTPSGDAMAGATEPV